MTTGDEGQRERIAERIRHARKLAGLSQAQVAELLNLHRPSISEMEAGRRRVTAEEATRLAEAFDVDLGWLLGETSEKASPADPRIELAARELQKLSADDLDGLLTLLAAVREHKGAEEG